MGGGEVGVGEDGFFFGDGALGGFGEGGGGGGGRRGRAGGGLRR